MKTTTTNALELIYNTLMQNTDYPQFDPGETACEVIDYNAGTIEFSHGGEEFRLKIEYR